MLRPELSLLPAQSVAGTGQAINNAGNALINAHQFNQSNQHRNALLELSRNEAKQNEEAHKLKIDQVKGQQLHRALKALEGTDANTRSAQIEFMAESLGKFGFDDDDRQLLSTDQGLKQAIQITSQFADKPSTTSALQTFNTLTDGLNPEQKENARLIELGLKPRAQGSSAITIANTEGLSDQVADSQKTIKASEAAGTSQGKGEENRSQDLINRGVAAAESTATIRRAIDLLDAVETGGFDAVALRAKQFFGVEGADEGELSNSLGKSVLSQLRETFGAAFTQEEGARLERIEASFGKSPETNKRLLRQALRLAERTATRALGAARERDDLATVEDIEDLLSFRLDDTQSAPEGSSLDDLINQYAD